MSRRMKNLLLPLYLFSPCLQAMDGAPVVNVSSVTFNYMDFLDDHYSNRIVKGTTIAFTIAPKENNGIECWSYRESGRIFHLYLKDSQGNDLGELKDINSGGVLKKEWEVAKLLYYFTFPAFPSMGGDRLKLLGEVPVVVYSCRTSAPLQFLRIKNKAQLSFDELTMTVDFPDRGGKKENLSIGFQFSSFSKAVKLINLDFFDPDGKRLVDEKGNPAYSGGGGSRTFNWNKTFESKHYSFKEQPGLLGIVVNYWAKIEEPELPVPREILLYDPQEPSDQQSK